MKPKKKPTTTFSTITSNIQTMTTIKSENITAKTEYWERELPELLGPCFDDFQLSSYRGIDIAN